SHCGDFQAEDAANRGKPLSAAAVGCTAAAASAGSLERRRSALLDPGKPMVQRLAASVAVVKPETVLGWQRAGWKAYWRWQSSHKERGGRPAIPLELQALIARMAAENRLWGQKRIQAELARFGFQVSARTVAKYMRGCRRLGPTGTWREFLTRHASSMWACDF